MKENFQTRIFKKLPLKQSEMMKFLALFSLIFFVFFNYVILRVSKDALIINASKDGANAIPFIKIWMVTPIAFLLMAIEIKLVNVFNRFKVFVINILAFTGFYLLFFFVLFPHLDLCAPTFLINILDGHLPASFSPFITMVKFWPISIFYVLSEMWASVVISLLAWGFANSVNSLKEAKNIYGYLGVGCHIAYFIAGSLMQIFINVHLSDIERGMHVEQLNTFLIFISVLLVGASLAAIYFFHLTEKIILKDEVSKVASPHMAKSDKQLSHKKKHKMGTIDSLVFVFKSPYLRHLAITVIGYGLTINIVEVIWKNQVRKYFPTTLETINFMAQVQIYLSFVAIIFQLGSTYLLKKWGWGRAAMICPTIILVTGILFFSFVLMPSVPWHLPFLMSLSPLAISVWLGAWQNVLSKGTKNSIYNVCKEIAFIPLDDEIKLKGKAAIDILGERFGKFGGSLLSMLMLMFLTSFESMVIGSMVILVLFSLQWLYSTRVVHKEFLLLEKNDESNDGISPSISNNSQEIRFGIGPKNQDDLKEA